MSENPSKYYGMLILAMFFWGGSWVSADILVEIAGPFTIGFFRFILASLFFLTLMLVKGTLSRKRYNREKLRYLVGLGLTGILGYGVFFLVGMQFTTAAQGAIIAGVNPASVSIFAHLMHQERLQKRWQYTGFVVSFTGIIFVIGVQQLLAFNLNHLIGNLIIVLAMITWGLYSSLGKSAMKKMTSLEATAGGVMVGTVFFGIGAVTEEFWIQPFLFEPVFWLNILYLGIFVTFLGFLFYFISIDKLGATRSAIFINLVPVFGTLLSALLLPDQEIYWTFIIGLALVIAGISIINIRTKHTVDTTEITG
ncbi:MAG: DMT family transporter [Candidatus Thorarchaeota archaeon]